MQLRLDQHRAAQEQEQEEAPAQQQWQRQQALPLAPGRQQVHQDVGDHAQAGHLLPAHSAAQRKLQQADERVLELLAQWITKGESNSTTGLGLGLGLPGGGSGSSLPEGPCRNSSVLFDFVVLEGSELPFEDQLHVLMRSGVIVGVHGAALTQQLFMPPGGCSAG